MTGREMAGIEGLRRLAEIHRGNGSKFMANYLNNIDDQIEREHNVSDREEHDAAAWVRDHGGIDHVREEWRSRVPYDLYERRRQRLLDHIAECETALGRRREIISELTHRVSDLTRENAELRKRAMPEGCEWPRYESGEPVRIGGEFMGKDGKTYTAKQIQFIGKCFSLHDFCDRKPQFSGFYGERVKRPAPKVYDADGVEIREGDRVWSTHLDEPHEWIVIDPHEDRDDSQTVLVSIGDRTGHARPEDLTHRAPVLAADGLPLEVGQTVYATRYGYVKCTVLAIEWDVDGYLVEVENEGGCKFRQTPDEFTHTRPVLGADGVPIRVGDTVYEVGESYPPFIVGRLPEPGAYRSVRVVYPSGAFTFLDPERLTHTKPEPPDSRQAVVNEIGDEMAARIDLLVSSGRWSDAS